MNVLLHESWEEVQNLSGRWNPLLVQSASNTIFLTWEWIHAWWNYASNHRPLVLIAWEGNSLQGISPLSLINFFQNRAWLKLFGDGREVSKYLDLIATYARAKEVAASLVQSIESERFRFGRFPMILDLVAMSSERPR
jgi:hypothetical protein